MALTSKIVDYDPSWPVQFNAAASALTPLFAESLDRIHHVGSTAVPELAAKPEIDILVVIAKQGNDLDWSEPLRGLGYRRGKDLSTGHQFYKRDVDGIRTHKLHVCIAGHDQISNMLGFRDLLREDRVLRLDYEALKRRLESANSRGISEYLAQKEPYIRKVMGS